MKISMDKEYQTRAARAVRIYAEDGKNRRALHGAVFEHGEWVPRAWYRDGHYKFNEITGLDLVEVKPRIRRSVWLSVYRDHVFAYTSLSEAKRDIEHAACISLIEIEIDCEEGDGLNEQI